MSNLNENKFLIKLGGSLVSLKKPIVMGILNITPDSFFDGGIYNTNHAIVAQVDKMLNEGATIIDVGAASSRPGAVQISADDESNRIMPVIKLLIKTFPDIKISVDTFRSEVAKVALKEGAVMVNDVSGGRLDEGMFDVIAAFGVPYVLMHSKGTPQTMSQLASYEDVALEVMTYFSLKINELKSKGVKDIILDVGFGFAKNIDHNFELLKKMPYFKELNMPLLVGISRKSMIYKELGISPAEALNGTTVLNTLALINGAQILRVHDVKPAMEAIQLFNKTYLN